MLEIGQYLNQYKMLAFRYQYIYRYDIDHLDEYYYLLPQKNVRMVIMSCSHVRAVKIKRKKMFYREKERVEVRVYVIWLDNIYSH